MSRSDYIRIALRDKMNRRNMIDFPPGLEGSSAALLPLRGPQVAPPEYADDPENFFWPNDDAYEGDDLPAVI